MTDTPMTDAALADYFDAVADLLDSQADLEQALIDRTVAVTTANRAATKKVQTLRVVEMKRDDAETEEETAVETEDKADAKPKRARKAA